MIRRQWPGTVIDVFFFSPWLFSILIKNGGRARLPNYRLTVRRWTLVFVLFRSVCLERGEKQSIAHRKCLNGLIMNTFSSFLSDPINPINSRLFLWVRPTYLIESKLCIGCFLSRRVFGTSNQHFVERWTGLFRGEFARLRIDRQRNWRIEQVVMNVRQGRWTLNLLPTIDRELLRIDVIDGGSKNNIVRCIDNCHVKFQDGRLERTTSKP